MPYSIGAIDVHKKVLMVVVATTADHIDDAAGAAIEYKTRKFGAGNSERQHLVSWLREHGVIEVVMESTAQYWKPVWLDLEPHFKKLHLAQAQSNKAPGGRKSDFKDAKRLARRLLSEELMLSFVPPPVQRMWRTLTRSKHQLVRDRIQLQNQMESLLEEARIKLSSVITDLLGSSGRRILKALSEGETNPVTLAALGDARLKCSQEELVDALTGSPEPLHLKVLKMFLERLKLLDDQIDELDRLVAWELKAHQDAVRRVAEIPGFGVDSAQQIIAEVGFDADAFPSASQFSSWVGTCPGTEESAEQNHSSRSPKGNRFVRRLLTQAAQAASRRRTAASRFCSKGSYPNSASKPPSGPLPTASAESSGKFSTRVSPTSRWALSPRPRQRSAALRSFSRPCEDWAIKSLLPRRRTNSSTSLRRGDFQLSAAWPDGATKGDENRFQQRYDGGGVEWMRS